MSERRDRYRPLGSLRSLTREQRAMARSIESGERAVDRVMGALARDIATAVRSAAGRPLSEADAERIRTQIEQALDRVYGSTRTGADLGQLGREVLAQSRDAGIAMGIASVQGSILRAVRRDPELRAAMGVGARQVRRG